MHPTHYPDPKTHAILKRDSLFAGTSLANNKVMELVEAFSLLYRLTGKREYHERIEKCARFERSHWRVDARRVEWNYRNHAGPWDFVSGKFGKGKTKTGSFIHPKGGYYTNDVRSAVRCYDVGVGFDKSDMKKLVQTNLEFMWMGDADPPRLFRRPVARRPQ